MKVGLLIITHDDLGQSLLHTATKMLGSSPLNTEFMTVPSQADPDELIKQGNELIMKLEQGDGVLILTDMFGATPSNVATQLMKRGNILSVAGINLPMLVRVLNYAHLNLCDLAQKALSGGRQGVAECTPPDPNSS